MIETEVFFNALVSAGVRRFSGVPDSLLKSFCAFVTDNVPEDNHLITANEGSAIAFAVGQYLATSEVSLVYLQNSGIGNAINPLLSLADRKVYGIPMVLLVGWRGEPGVKDEPQHIQQGAVMEELLSSCELPYETLSAENADNVENVVENSVARAKAEQRPVVILVKKNTFSPYSLQNKSQDEPLLPTREDAIKSIVGASSPESVFVSTTGMASRELFEIRVSSQQPHNNDFLTVGSMGHANMIALGIAQNTHKKVVCLDGDGASLMHMGNLAILGQSGARNLTHIVLNNAAHDSVGGQPTCATKIDLAAIAAAVGYSSTVSLDCLSSIDPTIELLDSKQGPHFIEVRVKKGARKDLGRPTVPPIENRLQFMDSLRA